MDLTLLKEKGPTASPPFVWATNATPQIIAVIASNNELLICLDFMSVNLSQNPYTFKMDFKKLCVLGFSGWLNI